MKQLPDKPVKKKYDGMLLWNITDTCNFSCYQCSARAKLPGGSWAPEKINIAGLKKFLNKLDYTLLFHITGGEPLLVRNINTIFREITGKHYLFLISNFISPGIREFAETVDPGRVDALIASAHIRELEKRDLLKTFINHCLLVKAKGFPLVVQEVAYPFQLEAVERHRKMFGDYGIDLKYEPFRGTWENRKYPDAYTAEEIRIFKPGSTLPLSLDFYKRKGKLCNAGYNIAVVSGTGKIKPCFLIDEKLGDIGRGMRFRKQLLICPFESCGCPFPVFFPSLYRDALESNQWTASPVWPQ